MLSARLIRCNRLSAVTLMSSFRTSKVIKTKTPIVASVLAKGLLVSMDTFEIVTSIGSKFPMCANKTTPS